MTYAIVLPVVESFCFDVFVSVCRSCILSLS
jgi:hypothetical protein